MQQRARQYENMRKAARWYRPTGRARRRYGRLKEASRRCPSFLRHSPARERRQGRPRWRRGVQSRRPPQALSDTNEVSTVRSGGEWTYCYACEFLRVT
eukprot:3250301-Pleurochrysis_carterae.AAC.1